MMTVRTYLAPSRTNGIGIFAAEPIPKGTMVWVFNPDVDRTLTEATIKSLAPPCREQMGKYCYFSAIYQEYVLCGDDGRFFNHSESPNCHNIQAQVSDMTVAARDIKKGEELICDYDTLEAHLAEEEMMISFEEFLPSPAT